MGESHRRGNALSSQLCDTFSALVGGTPELPPWFSHVVWGLGSLLAHIPPTPCSTKLPRTAFPHVTLRCTTSTLTPQHCLPAFLYMSPSHTWETCHSPHAPHSRLPSPSCLSHSCFCSPCCSRHACRKPFSGQGSTHQHFRAGSLQHAPSTGKC